MNTTDMNTKPKWYLSRHITPKLDKFTGEEYRGNHGDFWVSFRNNGDEVVVWQSWVRDFGGMFLNRDIQPYSIEAAKAFCERKGFEFINDVPVGHSTPKSH